MFVTPLGGQFTETDLFSGNHISWMYLLAILNATVASAASFTDSALTGTSRVRSQFWEALQELVSKSTLILTKPPLLGFCDRQIS